MNIAQAIYQLESLIEDRESFCCGDADADAIFIADIEALKTAITALKEKK